MVNWTSLNDSRIVSRAVVQDLAASTDGGICALNRGISALDESVTSTVLVPGCRWIASTMRRARCRCRRMNQEAVLSSSTLSITPAHVRRAARARRCGRPRSSAYIAPAFISCPLACTVKHLCGPYSVPVGMLTFQLGDGGLHLVDADLLASQRCRDPPARARRISARRRPAPAPRRGSSKCAGPSWCLGVLVQLLQRQGRRGQTRDTSSAGRPG